MGDFFIKQSNQPAISGATNLQHRTLGIDSNNNLFIGGKNHKAIQLINQPTWDQTIPQITNQISLLQNETTNLTNTIGIKPIDVPHATIWENIQSVTGALGNIALDNQLSIWENIGKYPYENLNTSLWDQIGRKIDSDQFYPQKPQNGIPDENYNSLWGRIYLTKEEIGNRDQVRHDLGYVKYATAIDPRSGKEYILEERPADWTEDEYPATLKRAPVYSNIWEGIYSLYNKANVSPGGGDDSDSGDGGGTDINLDITNIVTFGCDPDNTNIAMLDGNDYRRIFNKYIFVNGLIAQNDVKVANLQVDGYFTAKSLNLDTIAAKNINTTNLTVEKTVKSDVVEAALVEASTISGNRGTFDNAKIVNELTSTAIESTRGEFQTASVQNLTAPKANIADLTSTHAKFTSELSAPSAQINVLTNQTINSDEGNITTINAENAEIASTLTSEDMVVNGTLDAATATIDKLETTTENVKFSNLKAFEQQVDKFIQIAANNQIGTRTSEEIRNDLKVPDAGKIVANGVLPAAEANKAYSAIAITKDETEIDELPLTLVRNENNQLYLRDSELKYNTETNTLVGDKANFNEVTLSNPSESDSSTCLVIDENNIIRTRQLNAAEEAANVCKPVDELDTTDPHYNPWIAAKTDHDALASELTHQFYIEEAVENANIPLVLSKELVQSEDLPGSYTSAEHHPNLYFNPSTSTLYVENFMVNGTFTTKNESSLDTDSSIIITNSTGDDLQTNPKISGLVMALNKDDKGIDNTADDTFPAYAITYIHNSNNNINSLRAGEGTITQTLDDEGKVVSRDFNFNENSSAAIALREDNITEGNLLKYNNGHITDASARIGQDDDVQFNEPMLRPVYADAANGNNLTVRTEKVNNGKLTISHDSLGIYEFGANSADNIEIDLNGLTEGTTIDYIDLGESVDLNDITTQGYHYRTNNNAITNTPTSYNGKDFVVKNVALDNDKRTQIYYANDGRIFTRSAANAWNRLAHTEDVDNYTIGTANGKFTSLLKGDNTTVQLAGNTFSTVQKKLKLQSAANQSIPLVKLNDSNSSVRIKGHIQFAAIDTLVDYNNGDVKVLSWTNALANDFNTYLKLVQQDTDFYIVLETNGSIVDLDFDLFNLSGWVYGSTLTYTTSTGLLENIDTAAKGYINNKLILNENHLSAIVSGIDYKLWPTKFNSNKIYAHVDETYYIKQGGTLLKPLTVTGGEQSDAGKIVLDPLYQGQITDDDTNTLFGFMGDGALTIGSNGYSSVLRGNTIQIGNDVNTSSISIGNSGDDSNQTTLSLTSGSIQIGTAGFTTTTIDGTTIDIDSSNGDWTLGDTTIKTKEANVEKFIVGKYELYCDEEDNLIIDKIAI